MHPHLLAGRPPPLPHRRRPFTLALRATLWRTRFAVAAVFLGLAAAGTVQALRPADPPTSPVLVAARALAAGTPLTGADVRLVRFPVAAVPDGALTDLDEVADASTAVPLAVGTPVLPGLLVDDDVRGPPGTVVATVRFADPAVADLLSPGMRVDVLAATPEGGPGGVVATRALVLPVARRASPEQSALALGGSGDDSVPVLLAVSPDEAPALAGAAASSLLSAVVVP
ncbi:SAF domain-containing protein [Cellulomonas terrae]|uniref:SAF domain-containing protein n=1 Tax=Cellulomonas terrae TaxID=311234 RepID=A0A511JKC9_9CELL|nr:SAF domain-containing protein [Cellulomonas terrae]GEL98394.1 SAF domain-containing protein [Cellulomonas terrae]